MKASHSYLINSRSLDTFKPTPSELQLDHHKNYFFPLPYLSALTIDGQKAVEFLQGQLTADINQLNDNRIVQAGQCNLKGRLLALFDVVSWHGVQLILPTDLIEPTCRSLHKTAMLSRILIKENPSIEVFGFYLQNINDLLPEQKALPNAQLAKINQLYYCAYHLGKGFYIFLIQKEHVDAITAPFIAQQQMLGSLTWHTLRLSNQQINIYPESRGLFLPHRLDLQKTEYLSFTKGCYKGQEIIARTQYKSTLKHELGVYRIQTASTLFSGQKLYKPGTTVELAELVDYSFLDEDCYLIAISILKEHGDKVQLEGNEEIITLNKQSLGQSANLNTN